ncbi:hypothetical protein ABZ401_29585 [Streptomyces sp. NPDC005892]|uniref:hypothetical protein n=1 Tax=Streptomyces sp. NPDC005892 TaxID=3155593 RepID=UPI0033F0C24F
MQQDMNGFGIGLGERLGSYPIAGVGGGLLQLARRSVVALAAVLLFLLVVRRPPAAFAKGAFLVAVVLAIYGLRLAWSRGTARLGISRCYLHTGGLAVTNLTGGVRDAVAWSNVRVLNHQIGTMSFLMVCHRFEIERDGSPALAFLALGQKPAMAEVLLNLAAKNGIHR